MTLPLTPRYAVYFAPPPQSLWWHAGSHWLGRDEFTDELLMPQADMPFEAAQWQAITAEPRRYGFHATLKAPFRLGGGRSENDLLARLRALADSLQPVALGPLSAVTMGPYVVWAPSAPSPELASLAAHCVTELDDLRAPLTPAELARRQPETLDARGLELLQRYGYPHVLERFRLHFSLGGPMDAATAQRVIAMWAPHTAQLNQQPLLLDRLCLFVQAQAGQAFRRVGDALLQAPGASPRVGAI
jgi:putative phosphonate metabolism protein